MVSDLRRLRESIEFGGDGWGLSEELLEVLKAFSVNDDDDDDDVGGVNNDADDDFEADLGDFGMAFKDKLFLTDLSPLVS